MAVVDDIRIPAQRRSSRALRGRSTWLRVIAGGLVLALVSMFSACSKDSPDCPTDDGDPCTLDECKAGVAVNDYLGDGHPCFIGKLQGACMAGRCTIPCKMSSDCNDGLPCTRGACESGACVIAADDSQMAPEDGNACTEEHCAGGEVVSWAKPEGSACGGGMAECVGGLCASCKVPLDCGFDTECRTWTCIEGACVPKLTPYGQQTSVNSVLGDCRVWVCDGKGGVTSEPAPQDVPSSYEQCFAWICVGSTPFRTPKIGDKCLMASGLIGVCSPEGTCLQCVQDLDCGIGSRCQDGICLKCGDAQVNGDEVCGGSCGSCKGTACIDDTDCASGYCVETNSVPAKVCCNFACDGICQQCGTTGTNAGECIGVPVNQQDDSCKTPGMACSGAFCKWKVGYPCVQNADCVTWKCTNGTCAP